MIGDVFIRAGSDYGKFRYGCVGALVHSLEAPAKPGMAKGLIDWLKSEGLSPHTMSDPTPLSVQVLDETHAGAHAGSVANLYLVGFEQTGYAAWSLAKWTESVAFEAVKAVARSIARLWRVMGWNPNDVEWGSVAQLQAAVANAKAGRPYRPMLWTHFDVSQAFPGTTNHTDPGPGYPYAILRQMVKQYLGTWQGSQTGTPNPPPAGGVGGAEDDMPLTEDDLNKIAQRVWDRIFQPKDQGGDGAAAWQLLVQARNGADDLRQGRPEVLGVGDGNVQTRTEALAQVRNDVTAIKRALVDDPKA